MELSKRDVAKLAGLARLKLTNDETDRYRKNLGAILTHVDRVQTYMKGKDVVVDRRVVTDSAELRADHPASAASEWQVRREEFLASARAVKDHRIVVPSVFEQRKS